MIGKYIVPNASSLMIVMTTLSVPEYLLVESSLSRLGIGLTPPLTSWGVLLSDAQMVQVALQHPWLPISGLFICVAMLVFNFVGDAVRTFETRHRQSNRMEPGALRGRKGDDSRSTRSIPKVDQYTRVHTRCFSGAEEGSS